MGKLTGKVALVTGGARGLGRYYALRLASLGADVGIIDINLHSYADFEGETSLMTADTVMDEIKAMGLKSFGAEADITSKEQTAEAVKKIVDKLGDISIVVCNAGGGSGALNENTGSNLDFNQYKTVMARNLDGTINTVMAVAPIMKKNGYGKIITVASHTGLAIPQSAGYCHYGMAKAAIMYYTLNLATELGPYGITANCVAPGIIVTGRLAKAYDESEKSVIAATSLRRLGTPEDCAKVVEFLATDLSDFVTGETILVTGGTTGKFSM